MSSNEATQQRGEDKMTNQEIKNSPSYALENCADELTPEQFDYCIRQSPWLCKYFTDKLTDEQFDYCVHECPDTALLFCIDKLTEEQLDFCIFEEPLTAMLFCWSKLTDEQYDYCVELTKND